MTGGTARFFAEQAKHFISHAVIAGICLVIFGSVPEEWIARVVHAIPLLSHGIQDWLLNYGLRVIIVLIGLTLIVRDVRARKSEWRPSIPMPEADEAEARRKVDIIRYLFIPEAVVHSIRMPDTPSDLAMARAVFDRWAPHVERVLKKEFGYADYYHFRNQPRPSSPHDDLRIAAETLGQAFAMRSGYLHEMVRRYGEALARAEHQKRTQSANAAISSKPQT
ncbi:MAG TPA: hypothetical protein VMH36_02430 [Alphaproteobacteria bacterium]|nr:hypothetical protein [Alphaproteobacteria bacterium]